MPEHVNRDAAAGIPVPADADIAARARRFYKLCDASADGYRAILVESAMVTEGCQIKFNDLLSSNQEPRI